VFRSPDQAPPGAAAAWDHVLPPNLLAVLSKCFFPAAPFWAAHDYSDGSQKPPSPYFSYVVPLTKTDGTRCQNDSALVAIIRHIQKVTANAFPDVVNATAAEWWCHSRPHSSGHQLHFDSDDEGRGGVRNPIISTVTYLAPAGIGGETLVTAQATSATSLARTGHLCAGRRNRVLAFRGDLLHGVVPGAGCGSNHKKGRRVTFMVAFWKRLTIQDKPGAGSARPFSRVEGEPWAQNLVKPAPKIEANSAKKAKPTKTARNAFFKVPVWEDVDEVANKMDEQTLTDLFASGRMPGYDEFFQFA